MNIILCGMMGCGKSTVARVMAQSGGFKLIDTDGEIVKKYGDITAIFAKYGERRFREIESDVIMQSCSDIDGAVVSLGGGAVLRRENVDFLKKTGKIVYLRAGVQTLAARLNGSSDRPLLNGNLQEKIKNILNERGLIYESVADFTVDTDGRSPEEIANTIRNLSL